MLKKVLSLLIVVSIFPSLMMATPTQYTKDANQKVLKQLPFKNAQDFTDASQNFIAPLDNEGVVKNSQGMVIWDLKNYDFLGKIKKAPATVNPSLWRQAQLLFRSGLFKVVDGIYQIRGADLSNMTVIEGQEGIIVVDPLVSNETAKAALNLYFQYRPKRPISTVIYTHSHVDHFGGVKGIISQDDVDSGRVKVIAPAGFVEAALEENVMAGNAMARRASYMYGSLLPIGPEGQVTSGLGLGASSGETSLILPTEFVGETGQQMTIDGVKFVFVFAPDSEAPAEMLFYLPDFKAIGIAEDASHTMHNLYTLRGAKIRNARLWAKYLNQTIDMFGNKAEVIFGQHHWPRWGNNQVVDFLEKQRDMYKYLHDQTLRLANQGYTMVEIGEMLKLPDSLAKEWYDRGYYGSTNHNAKSVYNFYLGWFDANPSTLHQLPPVAASQKYVEYMGGSAELLRKAHRDFDNGQYRWVAQAVNHLVFAEPDNMEAKELLASTLDQLGYQSENGTWRNFYLTGAQELRHGVQREDINSVSPDVVSAMPSEMMFDYLAIKLNGPKAADNPLLFNLNFPDKHENFILQVKNGVLNYFSNQNTDLATTTVNLNRTDLNDLVLGRATIDSLLKNEKIEILGNAQTLSNFFSLLDSFDFWFKIVEPNTPSP